MVKPHTIQETHFTLKWNVKKKQIRLNGILMKTSTKYSYANIVLLTGISNIIINNIVILYIIFK